MLINKKQKQQIDNRSMNFLPIFIVLLIIILIIYLIINNRNTQVQNIQQNTSSTPAIISNENLISEKTASDRTSQQEIKKSDFDDKDYGYKFQYPSSWSLDKKESVFDSRIIVDKKIPAYIFSSSYGSELRIFPEGEFDHNLPDNLIMQLTFTVGGVEAKRYEYKNGFIYISFQNLHNFRIEFEPKNDNDTKDFENILSNWGFYK